MASLGCAAVAIYHLAIGVPVDDPWLFPVLVMLPAVLAAGFAVSLRLPPHQQTNVAVLSLAVLASLYTIESVIDVLSTTSASMPERASPAHGS